MKQILIILSFVIISGCATKYVASDLIGTWEAVSMTDLETGKIALPEIDFDRYVVEIRPDSLKEYEGDTYAWKLEGDSIFVSFFSFYIKDLDSEYLTVVHNPDLFGEGERREEVKFKKIK